MAKDPAIYAHQEWLGYVQPIGLVVSIPALIDASAFLNRNYGPDHQRFLSALPQNADGEPIPEIPDFVRFAQDVLYWDTALIAGAPGSDPVPGELEVNLENYNETLRPTYALRNLDGDSKWLLLISVHPIGTNLDEPYAPHDRGWQASPQARFERLLRQTGVQIGLLVNGREIRLVYAPEKELSGHITFKLSDMVQVAGRPIFAALQMLLGSERLYSVADKERLPAILANSRKYQNVVSTQLAEQVLEALYELLRGFQAANDQTKSELLRDVLARDPDHVYHGLLTTLLRLVFVLYAEDRGLLSTDPVYSNYYSVTGLYERLRADAGRYNDTMDQRYGAWAQLLALFRLIYSGGSHGAMKIPAREGYLFDPDRYLFLEGRHDKKDRPVIPRVSDGVLYRVLSKLLLLDGERLSYRTLAVEQIGSVYEAIMGFELQVAAGKSIAIKPAKKHGAPATINLEELLRTAADKRLKWFTETTDQKLTGQAADGLKAAATVEELLVALERKIAKTVTPNVVPPEAMIFQPSNERRKSGSHYTPSSLTGPIVEAALEPVLKQLGENPKPEQILNLKVCDPAMGSGAFLVEACRQLGDELMKAWHKHDDLPFIPADEEEALYAQRLVAQRCLYGVDKNPMAVDLAKLSLWLATLAKNHPFTFLDHSLRHGDSLVGLTRQQIATFHWLDEQSVLLDLERDLTKRIQRISRYRQRILAARENVPYSQLRQELEGAEQELQTPRIAGDTVVAAFFSADKPKAREGARVNLRQCTEAVLKDPTDTEAATTIEAAVAHLQHGLRGIKPFHWQLEFPEVFVSEANESGRSGFDLIVGNPPFAGKNTLVNATAREYLPWLLNSNEESDGNSDLVAFFFRRAFDLVRGAGTVGFIATNTIAQGDTRSTGLRWICLHGGTIYSARRRMRWPGKAAVIVSVIHFAKGAVQGSKILDGRNVDQISAYLFYKAGSDNPLQLIDNRDKSFKGSVILGLGFTFDDTSPKASSIVEMDEVIAKDPRNAKRIVPYIGGEEVNEHPTHSHRRYVINFSDCDEMEARRWPDLFNIVERKVKPERLAQNRESRARYWWRFGETTPALYRAIEGLPRVLVCTQVSKYTVFTFLPNNVIFDQRLVVFAFSEWQPFGILQSHVHETWALFFGSTMKDDPVYTPSDCFVTFPFPYQWRSDTILETTAREFFNFRAQLMQHNSEGLTATYNRFHDPEEDSPAVLQLRQMQLDLDAYVLKTYGWDDVPASRSFFLNYVDDEDAENGIESTRRKKPWRYRWPDEVRDEVLARLLELNRQRALEEGQVVPDDTEALPRAKLEKTKSKKPKAKEAEQGTASDQITMNLGKA
jgi:hypothetical protein